ncbi:STAS domain-containing protein [Laspinema sp. A4]|uniref:STAS domain-containing protein n=1 Tax=Laspinema sp. D2d TaxID=2953686 RepID=UPI0021BAAF4B|nr:STAS domain-containing protein [Laspinema sp. D2d]MCT7985130.1 STAS domain-containing protein [Laspinema sp. D2d]
MLTNVASPEISLIQLQGEFNASNAAALQSQLTSVVQSSIPSTVLVDMENVNFLDSAGLMALVSAMSLAHRLNRRFSLCGVSPSIRIIFEITQLDRVFELFETRAEFEAVFI